jgi:hypothetical protein
MRTITATACDCGPENIASLIRSTIDAQSRRLVEDAARRHDFAAGPPASHTGPASATGAVLVEGPDPGDRSFAVDRDAVKKLGGTGFNDRAQSLQVQRGYWIFCSDANFEGDAAHSDRVSMLNFRATSIDAYFLRPPNFRPVPCRKQRHRIGDTRAGNGVGDVLGQRPAALACL